MTLFDWAHNPGSTRPRVGMAALSFRERTGLRRLTNTEHQCRKYLTPRRSLSVRFATPAIPGRPEKLLSESGSRPARGPEPVRRRFGSASVVPFLAQIRTMASGLQMRTGYSPIGSLVLSGRSHAGTRRARAEAPGVMPGARRLAGPPEQARRTPSFAAARRLARGTTFRSRPEIPGNIRDDHRRRGRGRDRRAGAARLGARRRDGPGRPRRARGRAGRARRHHGRGAAPPRPRARTAAGRGQASGALAARSARGPRRLTARSYE